jgi:acyl-homoserine-lactone acylase
MRAILVSLLIFGLSIAQGQEYAGNVTIARDSLGVPHIYGKTDADAAYGLAWAHAEDNFSDIQGVLLAGKGMLGRAIGKKGAAADFVVALLRCRENARDNMGTLSPEFLEVVKGYISGINDYAAKHPSEVKIKNAFPASVEDYLTSVSLSLCVISGADGLISDLVGNKVATATAPVSGGSNAFAIHPSKTTTGEAFLAINSHQPLEGPVAWYEAHIQSGQGWNAIGGLFPGGLCILHGVNRDLGWAHTVNLMDKIDVYQLTMTSNGKKYILDGKEELLESRKVKLHVKGIPVPVTKTVYWSKYGATIKNKKGYFSFSLYGNRDIRGMEQWWRMNKAKGFSEFYKALEMQALPMFNIVYADRHDTIFYISGGRMPVRANGFDWSSTLPGDTTATLWKDYYPVSDLPQLVNPDPGYVYNTNHSPFLATAKGSNLDAGKYNKNNGYETWHNNRSFRFDELIGKEEKLSYEKFKDIKYDGQLPQVLQYPVKTDSLFTLRAKDYPDLSELITVLQQWDRRTDTGSKGAAAFLLIYQQLKNHPNGMVTQDEMIMALSEARAHLNKSFGGALITLGELQQHSRGNIGEPSWGLPDVLTAMYSAKQKDGRFRVVAGESYIELVRFPKGSDPIIESINCYGASSHPESAHYNDQLKSFIHKQTRRMFFDWAEVVSKAVSTYKPGL